MKTVDYEINSFITSCQLRQLSKKTIKSYEQTLQLFFTYMYAKHGVDTATKVKQIHVAAYIDDLKTRGKCTVLSEQNTEMANHPSHRQDFNKQISTITINNYIRNIKVFFNWMYENHEISRNPMAKVKQLKNERQPLNYISDDEFMQLIGSSSNFV